MTLSPPSPFIGSLVFKVARVRLHGFSEREISVVRSLMMSEIESAYLERDQIQSTSLRDEYIQVSSLMNFLVQLSVFPLYKSCLYLCFILQHFLHKEPVIGIEYEAQLQKSLLPREKMHTLLIV